MNNNPIGSTDGTFISPIFNRCLMYPLQNEHDSKEKGGR